MPAKCLVAAGQLLAVCVMVFSAVILLILIHTLGDDYNGSQKAKTYEETRDCGERMSNTIEGVSASLQDVRIFEKDGKADDDLVLNIVDRYRLWENKEDSSEKDAQTSYTWGNLKELYDDGVTEKLSELYYQYEEELGDSLGDTDEQAGYYSRLSKDYLEDDDTFYTKAEVLRALEKARTGAVQTDGSGEMELTEAEIALAKQIESLSGCSITEFSDLFLYMFDKGYKLESKNPKTVSGGTLAEYAAKNKETVSLQEMYAALHDAASAYRYVTTTQDVLATHYNLSVRFWICDASGSQYTNVPEWENGFDKDAEHPKSYIFYERKGGKITQMEYGKESDCTSYLVNRYRSTQVIDEDESVYLEVSLSPDRRDELWEVSKLYDRYFPWQQPLFFTMIIAAVLWVLLFILGTIQVEHHGRFERVPTEIAAAAGGLASICAILAAVDLFWYCVDYRETISMIILDALFTAACYAVCLFFYISLVRRIKHKTIWSNSLTKRLLFFVRELYESRTSASKLILLFGAFVLVHVVLILAADGVGVCLCLIGDVVVLWYLVREAQEKQKVFEGLKRIGSGDLSYQIDMQELTGESRKLAELVNGVGEGLETAVKEQLKSERMKADLITNVSHDIKTPLTSIINYVDLLKREQIDDPKVQGYLEILENKSQRLKHLTEDLVEASKASSGNLKLEFTTLDLNELVQQISGEFDGKFKDRNLSVVMNIHETPLQIRADGRRIWRVLENLYSNAAKYAMPGSRVYVETQKKEKEVLFTMKNMSEHPLNINADELTERFIRGDVSRSTEGSGLGLSIAQNLTQLQHGAFAIYLDGDLFKVTLTFDEVTQ